MTDFTDAIAAALTARSKYHDVSQKLDERINLAAIYDASITNCVCNTRKAELLELTSINNHAIDALQSELSTNCRHYDDTSDTVMQMMRTNATTAKKAVIYAMDIAIVDAKASAVDAKASAADAEASAAAAEASAVAAEASAADAEANADIVNCNGITITDVKTSTEAKLMPHTVNGCIRACGNDIRAAGIAIAANAAAIKTVDTAVAEVTAAANAVNTAVAVAADATDIADARADEADAASDVASGEAMDAMDAAATTAAIAAKNVTKVNVLYKKAKLDVINAKLAYAKTKAAMIKAISNVSKTAEITAIAARNYVYMSTHPTGDVCDEADAELL